MNPNQTTQVKLNQTLLSPQAHAFFCDWQNGA